MTKLRTKIHSGNRSRMQLLGTLGRDPDEVSKVRERYHDQYGRDSGLVGGNPSKSKSLYNSIDFNKNLVNETVIQKFLLPIAMFKLFRIMLYKKLLLAHKDISRFKILLIDSLSSFMFIIVLNILGLQKISSILFTDFIVSISLIFGLLCYYNTINNNQNNMNNMNNMNNTNDKTDLINISDEEKQSNMNYNINGLILFPYFLININD